MMISFTEGKTNTPNNFLELLYSFSTWTTCHNCWNQLFCALQEAPECECLAISL